MKRQNKESAGLFKKKNDQDQHKKVTGKKLIVILDSATLETVNTKRGYELLNCDEHQGIMKKLNRDFSLARPDIAHQCLLMLFDSPLNKAGMLVVYVRTQKNILFKIDPQTRIPRTYKRFAGLMVQLLHEFKIKSVENEGNKTLLKVIKSPITDHLPIACKKIGTSVKGTPVNINKFVADMNPEEPVVFVVGAMSKGSINADYCEQSVSISNYPLSGAVVCSRICQAFEDVWDVR
eukprot:TRINITY_DN3981_c0_g1_i1.p1 TRINITY_DN3981_c0_g1~~TRINITY_DN3981_c0_g1_i1.p1  ORF type:complete len:235 (-),score=36.73 TRINITY_DN3981_c0_g1_i1:46-750(-)